VESRYNWPLRAVLCDRATDLAAGHWMGQISQRGCFLQDATVTSCEQRTFMKNNLRVENFHSGERVLFHGVQKIQPVETPKHLADAHNTFGGLRF
jgi:hypothetical protein